MELLKGLSVKGHDVQVIYSRKSDRLAEVEAMGVKTAHVPFLRSSDRGYRGLKMFVYLLFLLMTNSVALLRMLSVARRFKPQVIHTNVSPIHLGYYLSRLMRVPHLWHLREFRRREDKSQPTFGYDHYLRLLGRSHTVSTTRSIKDFYGLTDCVVVYDGVIKERSTGTLLPLEERKNSFLFVGRVEQSKGIELLIDAFSQFVRGNDDWQLDIIGSAAGDYHAQLQSRIQALDMTDKVNFLGVCSDVQDKMAERKVVVISSLSEGFGIVTVEAMNSKCFVIGNDNTGTKEQLDNARDAVGNEVAFRFTDAEELLQQMRRYVSEDKDTLQKAVDNAYEVVNSLYGVERYVTEVAKCYESILK